MFLFNKSVFLVFTLMLLLSACGSGGGGGGGDDQQRPFVTIWQTDNFGFTNDDQIKIGTRSDEYDYNYTVNWGDGSSDSNVSGDITHTYEIAGEYTVSISGEFPQIYFGALASIDGGRTHDPSKLLSIEQWGDIEWQSMNLAFAYCNKLADNTVDAPDLALVTDMSYMFYFANTFTGDLSTWDVSSVTNMAGMFGWGSPLIGDLSTWDVSSVTDMSSMFEANSFNGDLSTWDVSSVTRMAGMFSNAQSFNGDLSTWDVSSVTDMIDMFSSARAFNGDLSAWDVSSVTRMDGMFNSTLAFNGDLSSWDVSSVAGYGMVYMFSYAQAFNGDLSAWDVSLVTNMDGMFNEALAFNGDLSTWDVSSVTNMSLMFESVTLSTDNYDALLVGWSNRTLQSDVSFNAGNSEYSESSQSARDVLTGTYNWTITDLAPN
jgi:surface protein